MVVDVPKIPKFVLGNRGGDGVNNLWLWMSRRFRNLFWGVGRPLELTICGPGCPDNSEICCCKYGGVGLTICGCGCPDNSEICLGNGMGTGVNNQWLWMSRQFRKLSKEHLTNYKRKVKGPAAWANP